MSRARHKKHHRAEGGKVSWKGGNQNVIREAEERKHGGGVHHEGEGEHGRRHGGKRARGGSVKRARGGAVGSDKRPLSSAATIKKVPEERHGIGDAGPAHD